MLRQWDYFQVPSSEYLHYPILTLYLHFVNYAYIDRAHILPKLLLDAGDFKGYQKC